MKVYSVSLSSNNVLWAFLKFERTQNYTASSTSPWNRADCSLDWEARMFSNPFLTFLAVLTIVLKAATALHYPISGSHTGTNKKTGARPMRRSINDFEKIFQAGMRNRVR